MSRPPIPGFHIGRHAQAGHLGAGLIGVGMQRDATGQIAVDIEDVVIAELPFDLREAARQ